MDNIAEIKEPQTSNTPVVNCIIMLYANIETAQTFKGGLSFNDCEALQSARNNLLKLFTVPSDNSNKSGIKDDLDIFVKICHRFQSLGAFSIEGSCRIYNNMTLLTDEVNKLL